MAFISGNSPKGWHLGASCKAPCTRESGDESCRKKNTHLAYVSLVQRARDEQDDVVNHVAVPVGQ